MSVTPPDPSPQDDAERAREVERALGELAAAAKGRTQPSPDALTTVRVPEPFQEPFLRAQRYVAEYFSHRVEQPDTATILIAGERYVLLRAASLSVEFVELVMKLYADEGAEEARSVANNLLFDLAHALGKADARAFQAKMGVSDPIENLSAGPIHFAFAGWAFVDISAESRPSPDENYFLLYDHPFSFESHSWLTKQKKSDVPVCVMNAGYSSGWCEESFGIPLVAVETECLAAGGERCRFVMAPPSRIEEHLKRYVPATSARRAGARRARVPEFFQRKRMEAELRAANEQLEARVHARTRELESATEQLRLLGTAVENAAEGFVIVHFAEGTDALTITFVNQAFASITGVSPTLAIGRRLDDVAIFADQAATAAELTRRIRHGERFELQATGIRPDGSRYALEIGVVEIAPKSTGRAHWIAVLRDVSERKAQLEALEYQALHDALTGLPNRAMLHDRIERGIVAARARGRAFALLFLDLDGFKDVNDTFGHATGDALLKQVGERLRDGLADSDTIARLGGDEFAIVLTGLARVEEAEPFARRLLAALAEPFRIDDLTLAVSASIGVAHYPAHGDDPSMLMRRADVAMYAAKSAHAGAATYDPRHDRYSPLRTQLVAELRTGIGAGQLELHYQPQIDLASGQVVRAEALLRWNRPGEGQLLPDAFLHFVEGSDLIDPIFAWVLDRALQDCSAWRADGHAIGVSVNLSPNNLHDDKLADTVCRTLRAHGLPPEALTLEITESGVLGDAVLAADIFQRLRAMGVGLSIDDFGTGHSSLMRLKHLPFTEIKVDRLFTSEMLDSDQDAAIVESTVDLGHRLGCVIVAEGVETAGLLARLRGYRCDFAQGHHICPPLAIAELRAWLCAGPSF